MLCHVWTVGLSASVTTCWDWFDVTEMDVGKTEIGQQLIESIERVEK